MSAVPAAGRGRRGGVPTRVGAPDRRRPAAGRVLVGGLLLCLLVAACQAGGRGLDPSPAPGTTDLTSAPSPGGLSVAVVLPPPREVDAAGVERLRRGLENLSESMAGQVREIRAVRADSPLFQGDAAEVLAGEGTDLVCILGAGATRTLQGLADRFPSVRFCTVPGKPDRPLPGNTLPVVLRAEEAGYLAGVGAREAAGQDPVALVALRTDPVVRRRRAGFLASAGAGGSPTQVRLLGGWAAEEGTADKVRAAVTEAYAAGAGVVHVAAGPAAAVALEVVPEPAPPAPSPSPGPEGPPTPTPGGSPTPTAGPARPAVRALVADLPRLVTSGEQAPAEILAVVSIDPVAGVRRAIERVLAGEDPPPLSVGLAEGAVRILPGGHELTPGVMARLSEVRDRIAAGEIPIPAPR